MATPVYSKDPVTGQAIWTLPGDTSNPPTTGPGGTPASGTPWVAPAGVTLSGSNYVQSPVQGMPTGYTSSQPTLESYLRQNEASYQNNPWAVEHGTAPSDITSLLQSAGQNYLLQNPGVGTSADLATLVSSLGGQYSTWYQQYMQYLQQNGQNIAGLAPSVQAAVQQAPAAPATPGGFVGPGAAAPTQATALANPAGTPLSATPGMRLENPSPGAPQFTPGTAPTSFRTNPGPMGGTGPVTDLNQLVYSPHAAPGSPAATPGITTQPVTSPAVSNPNLTPMLTAGTPSNGLTPDQFLAQTIASGGNPVNVTPAWQAMVAAQQQNINRGVQQLKEQFGASGNRFSTGFGTSLSDFLNQATLNQNSQLGQAQLQALSDAANRQMTAGGQLSSQAFQSAMQATNNNLTAALALMQSGYGAAGQIAGAQNTAGLAAAQQYTQLLQMGLSSAQALAVLNQQNLGLGAGLGGQQQTIEQQAIDRQVQQYMQGLPQYNPLMSFFAQGANTYPQLFQQQFPVSQLGSILGAVGGLLGASPAILSAIQQVVSMINGQGNPGSAGTINSQGGLGNNPLPTPPALPPISPDTTISLAQLFGA